MIKKIAVTTAVLSSLTFVSSFAKTEGNYFGVDLLGTRVTNSTKNISTNTTTKSVQGDLGVGVNYKHAMNFDGIFVAPEVYFNFNNANSKDEENGDGIDMRYTYGARLNVGYDINDRVAPFVNAGYQHGRFRYNDFSAGTSEDSNEEFWTYGAGVKFSVNEDVDMIAAYERSDLDEGFTSKYPQVIRLGASYKF